MVSNIKFAACFLAGLTFLMPTTSSAVLGYVCDGNRNLLAFTFKCRKSNIEKPCKLETTHPVKTGSNYCGRLITDFDNQTWFQIQRPAKKSWRGNPLNDTYNKKSYASFSQVCIDEANTKHNLKGKLTYMNKELKKSRFWGQPVRFSLEKEGDNKAFAKILSTKTTTLNIWLNPDCSFLTSNIK